MLGLVKDILVGTVAICRDPTRSLKAKATACAATLGLIAVFVAIGFAVSWLLNQG